MTYPSPICLECKHFDQESFDGMFCAAFPEGIPELIMSGLNDHSKPLPDQDSGIVFEQIKAE